MPINRRASEVPGKRKRRPCVSLWPLTKLLKISPKTPTVGKRKRPCVRLSSKLSPKTPTVSETVKVPKTNLLIKFKKGQTFSIIDFLSSKGQDYLVSPKDGRTFPLTTLNDFYVLVCCFTFPSDELFYFQALQALYSEHTRNYEHPCYKLVIILNFEEDDGNAFHAFFKKLSFDCLIVPFYNSKSRRLISDSLVHPYEDMPTTLALDPHGVVLQHRCNFLVDYGALSFPFTDGHFAAIKRYTKYVRHQFSSPCSHAILPWLLECSSLSPIGYKNKSVSTLSLEGKTVGLYLYLDGTQMIELHNVYKQCLENHSEFEIVLVPLAFDSLDPDSFSNQMKQSALKLGSTKSWLAFPFNDKICRTLWRISDNVWRDELLIMPCGDRRGELEATFMVRMYGSCAYPFTRDAIVNKKVEQLRSRPLESLLRDDNIRNKKVLFYFVDGRSTLYKLMKEECAKIKDLYPDALLFVGPLNSSFKDDFLSDLDMKKMSYEKCISVIKHVFMREDYPDEYAHESLVAFGKDGKILSRSAHLCLPLHEFPPDSLFEDTLHSEILDDLEEEINNEL